MNNVPSDAIMHAIQDYPKESCGLVVGGKYIRCRNIATNPGDNFVMCKEDMAAAMELGEIEAVIHSHPDAPCSITEADQINCNESAVPWCIIEVRLEKYIRHRWYEPKDEQLPIIGREFRHGVTDCLTVILEYYRRELGIDLGSFEREDNWWDKGENLYLKHLPEKGFYRIPDGDPILTGDVILMQIKSPVPNHAGIYIEDGMLRSEDVGHPVPNCLLHHMPARLSRRDVYGGYYLEKTVGVWRHGKA